MEITTQEYKRLTVVTVTGRVDSATSGDFESALHGLIEKGRFNLVLDMAGVEFLSSSGLRVMVSVLKTARQAGGELCTAQPAQWDRRREDDARPLDHARFRVSVD